MYSRCEIILVLLLQLFASAPLFAQSEKATITLTDGTILTGFIQADAEAKYHKGIHFSRSAAADDYHFYQPQELQEFKLETGEIYQSISLDLPTDQSAQPQPTLARKLANGTIELFLVQINFVMEKFILFARKKGEIYLLDREIKRVGEGNNLLTKNRYQGKLSVLTRDCQDNLGNPNNLNFTVKAITKFIDRYNLCRDNTYQAISNAESFEVKRIGKLYAGISSNLLYGYQSFETSNEEPIFEFTPIAGAGLNAKWDVYRPLLSRHLSLHIGLEFIKWFNVPGQLDYASKYNFNLGFDSNLYLNRGKVRAFAKLGFKLNMAQELDEFAPFSFLPTIGAGCYVGDRYILTLQSNQLSILDIANPKASFYSLQIGYAIYSQSSTETR